MSLLVLVPLMMTAILGFAAITWVLARKSNAQSLCVQEATQMQTELGSAMSRLLALNPKAKALRAERQRADAGLAAAVASALPPAIALARMRWQIVVAAQLALKAQQSAILAQAESVRLQHERSLDQRVRKLRVAKVKPQRFFPTALAVSAQPPTSLTPNYVPVINFIQSQAQAFSFSLDVQPPGPLAQTLGESNFHQKTGCSVSLQKEGLKWSAKILAANASSNWL